MPANSVRHAAHTLAVAAALTVLSVGNATAAMSDSATVTLNEWELSLANADGASRKMNLTVKNTGSYAHALEIERNGEELASTDNIPAGADAQLSVTLEPGTYEFYCPIDGHRERGLDAKVKVSQNGMSVVGSNESDSAGGGYSY